METGDEVAHAPPTGRSEDFTHHEAEEKVDGGAHRCQGCAPSVPGGRADPRARGGRRGPENVTNGANLAAIAGPIPRTRWSSSKEPKGPFAWRSATIREANAGPIPGRRSNSSGVARSRSTGSLGAVAGAGASGRSTRAVAAEGTFRTGAADLVGRRGRPPAATAESTAAIWAARAARSPEGTGEGASARQPRTPSPRAATAATKSRARRSAGVGTRHDALGTVPAPHPSYAGIIAGRAAP